MPIISRRSLIIGLASSLAAPAIIELGEGYPLIYVDREYWVGYHIRPILWSDLDLMPTTASLTTAFRKAGASAWQPSSGVTHAVPTALGNRPPGMNDRTTSDMPRSGVKVHKMRPSVVMVRRRHSA